MCELYFGQGGAGERCPGEEDCQIFQSAAFVDDLGPDAQPIGKTHVCGGCDLRSTKPPKLTQIDSGIDAAELAQIVEQIETLAAEAQAGFGYTLAELTPLEFELLIHWQACVRSIERSQQTQIAQMLGALFTTR